MPPRKTNFSETVTAIPSPAFVSLFGGLWRDDSAGDSGWQ